MDPQPAHPDRSLRGTRPGRAGRDSSTRRRPAPRADHGAHPAALARRSARLHRAPAVRTPGRLRARRRSAQPLLSAQIRSPRRDTSVRADHRDSGGSSRHRRAAAEASRRRARTRCISRRPCRHMEAGVARVEPSRSRSCQGVLHRLGREARHRRPGRRADAAETSADAGRPVRARRPAHAKVRVRAVSSLLLHVGRPSRGWG
jgi:hypothetical protein